MIDQQAKAWTVRDLMKSAIEHLQKRGFEEARLNVELLLSHALECQRIELYTNFDKPLAKDEVAKFRSLYERRLNREPVQYIVGTASFMGLQLKVDPRVLIPRPETETLVEQAIVASGSLQSDKPVFIIEIGTGSGNIAISLAKFVKNSSVTSIDNSAQALEVAAMNVAASGAGLRVNLKRIDVFEPVDQILLKRFDLLVSNPPYVPQDEWNNLQPEVRDFEPRGATTDFHDGLEFYRRIVELAPYLLVDGGTVLVEVGDGQAVTVLEMMTEAGFFDVSISQDLQGVDRVVAGKSRARSRNLAVAN